MPHKDSLAELGIKAYLDQKYLAQGGYSRLVKVYELGWPVIQIAKEFGVRRQTVHVWLKLLKEGES